MTTKILIALVSSCVLMSTVQAQEFRSKDADASIRQLAKGFRGQPKIRFGFYPSSTIGTNFIGPEKLGQHSYGWALFENNGIMYTCKAGHIDITHLRLSADWTAHLAAKSFRHLTNQDKSFSFKQKIEPSIHFVDLEYDSTWNSVAANPQVVRQAAIEMGQYLAYNSSVWHEILTWFGFKCMAIYPEVASAFSWEDSFSNLLGTYIAATALNDTEHSYNKAVTLALQKKLKEYGVQPGSVAKKAADKVKGKWFSGDLLFVEMKKRNLDIGLDDGYVTAVVVPSVDSCRMGGPAKLPVYDAAHFRRYGITIKTKIEPREWEKDKILAIIYPDKTQRKNLVIPDIHYPLLMAYIAGELETRYGNIAKK